MWKKENLLLHAKNRSASGKRAALNGAFADDITLYFNEMSSSKPMKRK